jgi:Tfp pilus assembly protein PilV
MRNLRSPRGTTLLEAMVALVVMLVGALGVIGLHETGLRLNADARRIMRASAIAQDLVDNINLWPFNDARLSNPQTGNDLDVGDTAFAFQGPSAVPDHTEADLGVNWTGIPTASLGEFQRFWNVAPCRDATGNIIDIDGNGNADAICIAVIVRWPLSPTSWRRIVAVATKLDPSQVR